MLEKETTLKKVPNNSGLICLTTILKNNHTVGRGDFFPLTKFKQKLHYLF